MSITIPSAKPSLGLEEANAVLQVLQSGILAHGSMNDEFERAFAEFIGVKHAISMNSCTSALILALECQGITGEVIVPSFTFVASINAILKAGATPKFIDIKPFDYMLNEYDLEKHLTDKTQAVMVVHYAGATADLQFIDQFCKKHGLKLIEDSAECIGGSHREVMAGSVGTGCFSFFPSKNMTTGEGGMLTTNDDELAAKVRLQIAHGVSKQKEKPWHRIVKEPGYNFRMSNILAAIGVEQLKKLPAMNEKRRQHAQTLIEALQDTKLWLPRPTLACHHVYQMFPVVTAFDNRDAIVEYLNENGVQASVHFDPPVHLQMPNPVSLPVTEWISSQLFTLPMYPDLSSDDLQRIIFYVREAVAVKAVLI